jgi:hypothetical protein
MLYGLMILVKWHVALFWFGNAISWCICLYPNVFHSSLSALIYGRRKSWILRCCKFNEVFTAGIDLLLSCKCGLLSSANRSSLVSWMDPSVHVLCSSVHFQNKN